MTTKSKQAQWAERIAAWERSGLSRRRWCEEHGFNVHTLDYWRRQLPVPEPLIPVVVTPPSSPVATPVLSLEVRLPNAVALQVPLTAEVSSVVPWVRALRAC